MKRLAIYNENCVMKGSAVPQRLLDDCGCGGDHETGDECSCGDWAFYCIDEETATFYDSPRGTGISASPFNARVAATIREHIYPRR